MIVVSHINTFPYGGAATAALRLHREMRRTGFDSRFFYDKSDRESGGFDQLEDVHKIGWAPETAVSRNPISRVVQKRRLRKIYRLYDKHLASRNENLEVFSMPELPDQRRMSGKFDRDQIFHLHWIAFMADYLSFFDSIPNDNPIVWTLHDMNPLTGGCHYSNGCERFRSGCGSCPQVQNTKPRDVSYYGFKTKKHALRNKRLAVVTPSRWLKELAESSPVFPATTTFHHIRLGFNLDELRPIDRQQARRKIGLNTEKVVIGFGAESINNRRKGFDLLLAALDQLPGKSEIECAVFGSGNVDQFGFDLPKTHSMGFVNDPETLTNFYSACDLVVVPSREDNQPQVGLEAMACGTPVIGFDVGGVGEYVQPGITGALARPESSEDLSRQIERLIDEHEQRIRMSNNCRELMQQEFDIVKQSQKYVELYSELSHSTSQRRSA